MTRVTSPYFSKDVAERYEEDRFSRSFGRHLRHEEIRLFLDGLSDCPGKILDVGTGTGKLALALIRNGYQVVSIDQSPAMLDVAKRRAKEEKLEGIFLEGDAQHLGFSDKSFEAVVSSRVLMHVNDWRRTLAEWCRVSQHIVVVDFPHPAAFAALDILVRRAAKWFGRDAHPYRAYTVRSVQRELTRHGFRVTRVHKGYFLPIAFHRSVNHLTFSLALERFFRRIGFTRFFGSPVTLQAIYSEGAK